MADIHPFCGLRYNPLLVKDLAAVICPPYDIITPQKQAELYHRSEHNFVRLEFGRELPQDTAMDNKYTRAAATLAQWLRQGVLQVDATPAIYLHDHYFVHQGKEYRRRGIIVRVRLEAREKMVVRPHEGTMTAPKSDRLSLLWALQANTSAVLALFDDQGEQVTSRLATQEQLRPIISVSTAEGEKHDVRAMTETGVISQIRCALADQPLYIADGHHRYESALTYQQERSAQAVVSGDEGFNFVMMTLVDFADPGLVILPPHRLVRGVPRSTVDGLLPKLPPFFEIQELSLGRTETWQKVDDFLAQKNELVRVVLFGLIKGSLFLLKLRDFAAIEPMMPYFHSERYKKLAVSVVDHVILEKLLGLNREREEAFLAYSYDPRDAVNKILDEEYQLALLLSPVRAEVIKAIADAGDRMPRKSTYFYPKLPSGLVFHRLS